MEFAEKINQLKERVVNLKDNLQTEEATKTALIMPFLSCHYERWEAYYFN